MTIYYSTELYHHGIKGQKWGIRRYQNLDGTYTEEGLERRRVDNSREKGRRVGDESEYYKKAFKEGERTYKEYKFGELEIDDNFKRAAIVGAITVSATLAAYGAYKADLFGDGVAYDLADQLFDTEEGKKFLYTSGMSIAAGVAIKAWNSYSYRTELNEQREQMETNTVLSDYKKLSQIPKTKQNYAEGYQNGEISEEDVMNGINSKYPQPGYTNNCMLCTTATILRMMGYDVKANATADGYFLEQISDWFDGSKTNKLSTSPSKIQKAFEKEPVGSYGNFTVSWAYGGGHSMFYYVKDDGVHILDSQCNTERDINYFNMFTISGAEYTRLDNTVPTELCLGAIQK